MGENGAFFPFGITQMLHTSAYVYATRFLFRQIYCCYCFSKSYTDEIKVHILVARFTGQNRKAKIKACQKLPTSAKSLQKLLALFLKDHICYVNTLNTQSSFLETTDFYPQLPR